MVAPLIALPTLRRLPPTRLPLLVFLWWMLTGGEPSSWLIGVPCILLALAAPLLLPGRRRLFWRPWRLLLFLPFFLASSLRAGFDVARRALLPSRPLRPGLVAYQWQMEEGPGRVFLANVLTLLPGTLCVTYSADHLLIHVLDHTRPIRAEVQRLEAKVSLLFPPATEPETLHG